MELKNRGRPPLKTKWAYAYQISPPQTEARLHAIKALLDREHSDARLKARNWKGKFIFEQLSPTMATPTPSQE